MYFEFVPFRDCFQPQKESSACVRSTRGGFHLFFPPHYFLISGTLFHRFISPWCYPTRNGSAPLCSCSGAPTFRTQKTRGPQRHARDHSTNLGLLACVCC